MNFRWSLFRERRGFTAGKFSAPVGRIRKFFKDASERPARRAESAASAPFLISVEDCLVSGSIDLERSNSGSNTWMRSRNAASTIEASSNVSVFLAARVLHAHARAASAELRIAISLRRTSRKTLEASISRTAFKGCCSRRDLMVGGAAWSNGMAARTLAFFRSPASGGLA